LRITASSAGGGGGAAVGRGWRARRVVDLGEQDLLDDLARERRAARDQLIGDAADRVHVEATVEGLALDLLRGHVVRGAGDAVARAGGVGREHRGDPEVDQLDHALAAASLHQDDVLGLDVAVDDAVPVRGGEALAELAKDRHDLGGAADRVLVGDQVLAVEQLHAKKQAAVGELAEVEDLDDVAVTHATGGARLVAKHLGHLRLLAQIEAKDLEGDVALDVDVRGFVDDAHAALAEPADQAIARARDDLADDQAQARALGGGARGGGALGGDIFRRRIRREIDRVGL
jgi:hypothetical protein